jgi:hypothetical protein
MNCKCPSCGASGSLELFLGGDDNAKAIMAALELSPIGKPVLNYLCLFRPAKGKLSPARFAKLLGELSPLIAQQRIERNGVVYDAPQAVWAVAIDKILTMRDAGKLATPLKTHGYLFEIIVTESAKSVPMVQGQAVQLPPPVSKPLSGTAQALSVLQARKGGDRVVAG